MTPRKVPSYRLHKASGQAVVVLNGTSIYLGPFDSPESRARYDRVVAGFAHHSPFMRAMVCNPFLWCAGQELGGRGGF